MTVIETTSSFYLGLGVLFGVIGMGECLSQPRPVYRRSWLRWWLDGLICILLVFPIITLCWPFYLFMRR